MVRNQYENFEPFLLACSPVKAGTLVPFLVKYVAILTRLRDKHRTGGGGEGYRVARMFLFF